MSKPVISRKVNKVDDQRKVRLVLILRRARLVEKLDESGQPNTLVNIMSRKVIKPSMRSFRNAFESYSETRIV